MEQMIEYVWARYTRVKEPPEKKPAVLGDLTVLLSGDFRQILPVILKGKRADIVQCCINRSQLWKYCKVFKLTRSMRVNEYYENGEIDTRKQDFNQWVLAVGDGTMPAKKKQGGDEATWIEIPERFLIKEWTNPIEQIVQETYSDFTTRQHDDDHLKERAILTPRNDDTYATNEYMFKNLAGDTVTYNSANEICKASTDTLEQHNLYLVEFLNSLNFPGMPPHSLCLKKELPIMLIRNVNPSKGLCNGTRLTITDVGRFCNLGQNSNRLTCGRQRTNTQDNTHINTIKMAIRAKPKTIPYQTMLRDDD
nr:hypothetical protein [Tanacetum cinerariifolium]